MTAFIQLFNHDQLMKGIVPPGAPAGCVLPDAGSTFPAFNLMGATFTGASFMGSKFMNCNLTGTTIAGCKFINVTFNDCNFSGASITATSFSNCKFKNCNFSGNNLMQVKISSCNMDGTRFNNVKGRLVDWKGSKGKNSSWKNCDIKTTA